MQAIVQDRYGSPDVLELREALNVRVVVPTVVSPPARLNVRVVVPTVVSLPARLTIKGIVPTVVSPSARLNGPIIARGFAPGISCTPGGKAARIVCSTRDRVAAKLRAFIGLALVTAGDNAAAASLKSFPNGVEVDITTYWP